MLNKAIKQLKIFFITIITTCLFLFIGMVLYAAKYIQTMPNNALERWSIILTLAGIVVSLKFVHPIVNKDEDEKISLKKYKQKYYLRLLILFSLFLLNICFLYITGIKNFTYLAFISMFALFLCAPSKKLFNI